MAHNCGNCGCGTDFGTPERVSETQVELEIDRIKVSVPQGTSLLRAAAVAGIKIPKLCATESLEPFGSCRLCIVEIEGRRGYPASCTTPVEPGMKVFDRNTATGKSPARHYGTLYF